MRKFVALIAAAASAAMAFNVLQFFAKGAHGAQTGFGPGEITFFAGVVGVGVFMAINRKKQEKSGGASVQSKGEELYPPASKTKCDHCGKLFPSNYYLEKASDGKYLCEQCRQGAAPTTQKEAEKGILPTKQSEPGTTEGDDSFHTTTAPIRKQQSIYQSRTFNDFTADFTCRVCKRNFGRLRISGLRFVTSDKLVGCYCSNCSGMICKECQSSELDAYLEREQITHFAFPGAVLPVAEAKWHLKSCCLGCSTVMKEVGIE